MLADGTLKTIEDEEDIYISLTDLCHYFANATKTIISESSDVEAKDRKYVQGLIDMISTIAVEVVELGKFEAQRRMIEGPEDLLNMIDKANKGMVE